MTVTATAPVLTPSPVDAAKPTAGASTDPPRLATPKKGNADKRPEPDGDKGDPDPPKTPVKKSALPAGKTKGKGGDGGGGDPGEDPEGSDRDGDDEDPDDNGLSLMPIHPDSQNNAATSLVAAPALNSDI